MGELLCVLVTDRVPHVRRGIQEESRSNLDHETSRQVTRERDFSVPETKRHRRLEKGFPFTISRTLTQWVRSSFAKTKVLAKSLRKRS